MTAPRNGRSGPVIAAGEHAPVVAAPERSLFLERPSHVDLPSAADADFGPTFPTGFSAAAVRGGIKESGRPDVGIIAVDEDFRKAATGAAVYTRNAFPAAPVELCRADSSIGSLVAVAMNSGNANACTGRQGLETARASRRAAADALGTMPERLAVASTGIIGEQLDADLLSRGFSRAASEVRRDGGRRFAEAILTTDRFPKLAQYEVRTSDGPVRIGGCAKGAGMIAPSMATMLAVLTTDAVLAPDAASAILHRATEAGFNRVTVDGEMSTNDCVFFMASGASGVRPGRDGLEQLASALEHLALRLGLMMIADGEGASRIARVRVRGLPSTDEAGRAARAVADSPLVKTALYGGDPNWGRVLGSVGGALPDRRFPDTSLDIGGVRVVDGATALILDARQARVLDAAMQGPEIDIQVNLGAGSEEATVFFSDLGYEYVRINAEYHT